MNKSRTQYKNRLLYIHASLSSKFPDGMESDVMESDVMESDVIKFLSEQGEWKVKTTFDLGRGCEFVKAFRPDMIMVDFCEDMKEDVTQLISDIRDGDFKPEPFFIAVIPGDAEPCVRSYLLENGYDDFLIKPFAVSEFAKKTRLYLQRNELQQNLLWKNKRLNTSLGYLEKFKSELILARKALSREKSLLHSSLKQINAMTVERENLRKELKDFKTGFHVNVKEIESFIVKMIQSRKEKNRGHAKRVAEISVFVAEQFCLDRFDRENLKKAALLHETGMLFIPESLFYKDRELLTEYEKEIFERHPATGAGFLKEFSGLENAAEIIFYLHENADGSGRPQGLKRKFIPLLSRILAGADMLDELWSQEPSCTLEELLFLLEESAGVRLDPRIVNCLEKYAVTYLSNGSKKVKELGVYQLKPGMEMCAGMFTATGTKLFSAGTVLTEESIKMMIKYNREYPLEEIVSIKAE